MAALVVNTQLDFNALKEILVVTDGNLASHIKALEKFDFIASEKRFLGKKPNTRYHITPKGKRAFDAHLSALETLINLKKT